MLGALAGRQGPTPAGYLAKTLARWYHIRPAQPFCLAYQPGSRPGKPTCFSPFDCICMLGEQGMKNSKCVAAMCAPSFSMQLIRRTPDVP
jgi:hypothetical protein